MYMRREAGFTLFELLVVIVILSALIAALAPGAVNAIFVGRAGRVNKDIDAITSGVSRYLADTSDWPTTGATDGVVAFQRLYDRSQVPADIQRVWQGPYLNRPDNRNPFGGNYELSTDSITIGADNYDSVVITVRDAPIEVARKIDEGVDRGDGAVDGIVTWSTSNNDKVDINYMILIR